MTPTPDASARSATAGSIIRRRARGHTRLVRVLRWLLPVAMLGLLGLLGSYVAAEAVRSSKGVIKDTPTEIRMTNPHLVGRDDHGRAFNISAREAAREDADMQRVDLSYPVMIMDLDGPRPKTMTADRGVYDERTRLLKLKGHVRLDDSAASTLATDEALVDTKAGTVSGVSSMAASSPSGAIQAGSYTANEKTGHVILHGGVHGQLKGR